MRYIYTEQTWVYRIAPKPAPSGGEEPHSLFNVLVGLIMLLLIGAALKGCSQ
jgi:hypothetical protein